MGVSRKLGTFWDHFPSRKSVFAALLARGLPLKASSPWESLGPGLGQNQVRFGQNFEMVHLGATSKTRHFSLLVGARILRFVGNLVGSMYRVGDPGDIPNPWLPCAFCFGHPMVFSIFRLRFWPSTPGRVLGARALLEWEGTPALNKRT